MVHPGNSAPEGDDGASCTVDPTTDYPKEEVILACKAHYVGQAECGGCDSPGCPNTASHVLKKIAGECMVVAAMCVITGVIVIFFGVGVFIGASVAWGHCAICFVAWIVAGCSLGSGVCLLGCIKKHARQVWRGHEDVVRAVKLYVMTVCSFIVLMASFAYGTACFNGCMARDYVSTGM